MRIFPVALIVIGTLGVAKHFGFITIGMFQLIGPLLLIALGVALFFRRPRQCRDDLQVRHGGGSKNISQSPQPPTPAQ